MTELEAWLEPAGKRTAALELAAEAVRAAVAVSTADNTKKAYRSDSARFERWCADRDTNDLSDIPDPTPTPQVRPRPLAPPDLAAGIAARHWQKQQSAELDRMLDDLDIRVNASLDASRSSTRRPTPTSRNRA